MSDNSAVAAATSAAAAASAEASEADVNESEATPEEQAELDAEAKSEAEKAAKPAEANKTYKVKIDGQEVDLTEDELRKYASLGKSAYKRMEEAATVRKENEALKKDINSFFELIKNDPLRILKDEALGLDLKKIAEMVMNEEIEKARKTPEQLQIEELQKQLQGKEKREKEVEEGRKKLEWEKLQNEAAASIERDIMEALKTKELPESPYVMSRMVNMLYLAAQNGINLTAKDVLPVVKKQIMDDFRGLTGILPEDKLEEMLGEDKISNLRKRYLKKVKQVAGVNAIKSSGGDVKSAAGKDAKAKEKVSAKDFFKKLGSY